MCIACDPVVYYYVCDYARPARVFGGINFGDLKKIRQLFAKLKSPQKFPAIWYVPHLQTHTHTKHAYYKMQTM